MPKLAPFQALRYAPTKATPLSGVMAPPYDIISPADQDKLYEKNAFNIVRIDFGKDLQGDDGSRNRYTRAAKMFELWRSQGILKTDKEPGIYLIAHDYATPEGKKMSFMGFYSLLKVEDYKKGSVKPHERTLSKPKSDRYDLTRATGANLSPIFFLFPDKGKKALAWMKTQSKRKPDWTYSYDDPKVGGRHRLWIITQKAAIARLLKPLAKVPAYIADGHHRYETMLRVAKEDKKVPAAQWTMACLTPFENQGLIILPTHRMIEGMQSFSTSTLLQKLGKDFDIKKMTDLKALNTALAKAGAAPKNKKAPTPHAFGLITNQGGLTHNLLLLKANIKPVKAVLQKRSLAYKDLDVSLLQALVLEKALGMTEEGIAAQENIYFEKTAAKCEQDVVSGKAQAALLLNATRLDQLKAVSDAKDVMPQKSTYFLPKLITGMVLREIK